MFKLNFLVSLLANFKFKMVILIVAAICIFIFFVIPLSYFNTDDVIPRLEVVDIKELERLQTRYFSVKVDTGLFIKSFSVFDPISDEFTMDAIIWFEFNAGELMPDIVEKFAFSNGSILYKSPPDVKVKDDKVFIKYDTRVAFKGNLKYPKFPFNDHRVPIILTNNFVAPEEMYFQVNESSFGLSSEIVIHNWIVKDLDVEAGYTSFQLDKEDKEKKAAHPKALFIINIEKASIRRILIIFIPFFTAAFFALFSFLMGISNIRGRFSLAISAIIALLGYRFVIEQMMPKVGYFTTTDEIYSLLLIFAFVCFLFQVIITRYFVLAGKDFSAKKIKQSDFENKVKMLNFIKDIVFIFITLFFVISVGWFLVG